MRPVERRAQRPQLSPAAPAHQRSRRQAGAGVRQRDAVQQREHAVQPSVQTAAIAIRVATSSRPGCANGNSTAMPMPREATIPGLASSSSRRSVPSARCARQTQTTSGESQNPSRPTASSPDDDPRRKDPERAASGHRADRAHSPVDQGEPGQAGQGQPPWLSSNASYPDRTHATTPTPVHRHAGCPAAGPPPANSRPAP
jgi:hypothetical protein